MTNEKKETVATTQTIHEEKPHEEFEQYTKFGSIPTSLTVKAKNTETIIKTLKKNPRKYSFGKIAYQNGILEYFMYPLSCLDRVLKAFLKHPNAKTTMQSLDLRKIKEEMSLKMKIYYFLNLTKKRKKEYLRKKGFFANINTQRDIDDE